MKKIHVVLFLTGSILGILAAFLLRGGPQPEQAVYSVFESDALEVSRRLTEDALLFQNGQPVGELARGTRIWERSAGGAEEEFQLFLEWENDGTFDTVFLSVEQDGTPLETRAYAILNAKN